MGDELRGEVDDVVALSDSFLRARRIASHAFPGAGFWGFACLIAWALSIYTGEFFITDWSSTVQMLTTQSYVVSMTVLSVTIIVVAILHNRAFRFIRSSRWMLLAGLLASVGTLLAVVAARGGIEGSFFFVGSALTGAATGLIYMRCAFLFVELSPRDSIIAAAMVQIIAFLIYTFVISLNNKSVALVMLLCLPVAAVALTFCGNNPDEQTQGDGSRTLPKGFWRLLVGAFVLAAAFCFIRGYFPNSIRVEEFAVSRDVTTTVCIGAYILLILICMFLRDSYKTGQLCYWLLVAITFVFVLAPIVGLNTVDMGTFFGSATMLVNLTIWSILSGIVYKSGSSFLRVFGFGFAALSLGSAVGWFVGGNLYPYVGTDLFVFVNAALVIAVLAVALVIFSQSDFIAMANPPEIEREEIGEEGGSFESKDRLKGGLEQGSGSFRPRWRVRMECLADRYALSERETEVFKLMAKGKSAQNIAEEIGVSYNTARTHVRNVYSKCGIHSRNELQMLVDREEPAEGAMCEKSESQPWLRDR